MAKTDLIGSRIADGLGATSLESSKLQLERAREKEDSSFIDELTSTRGLLQALVTGGALAFGGEAAGAAGAFFGLQQLSGAEKRSRQSSDLKESGIIAAEDGVIAEQRSAEERGLRLVQSAGTDITSMFESDQQLADFIGSNPGNGDIPDFIGAAQEKIDLEKNRARGAQILNTLGEITGEAARVEAVKHAHDLFGWPRESDEYYTNLVSTGMKFADFRARWGDSTPQSVDIANKWLEGKDETDPGIVSQAYAMLKPIVAVGAARSSVAALEHNALVSGLTEMAAASQKHFEETGEVLTGAQVFNTLSATTKGQLMAGFKVDTPEEYDAWNIETFVSTSERAVIAEKVAAFRIKSTEIVGLTDGDLDKINREADALQNTLLHQTISVNKALIDSAGANMPFQTLSNLIDEYSDPNMSSIELEELRDNLSSRLRDSFNLLRGELGAGYLQVSVIDANLMARQMVQRSIADGQAAQYDPTPFMLSGFPAQVDEDGRIIPSPATQEGVTLPGMEPGVAKQRAETAKEEEKRAREDASAEKEDERRAGNKARQKADKELLVTTQEAYEATPNSAEWAATVDLSTEASVDKALYERSLGFIRYWNRNATLTDAAGSHTAQRNTARAMVNRAMEKGFEGATAEEAAAKTWDYIESIIRRRG